MSIKEIKNVRLNKEDQQKRLNFYHHKVEHNNKGVPKLIQGLHLRATFKYLLLSTSSLYECNEIEVLGFNKLNGDWHFDSNSNTLTHLAVPQSFRDFSDRREADTYPISLSVNGIDGISQGLYAVVCKCLEYEDTRNYLLWIDAGKSRLVDLRNNCSFQIFKLK